MSEEFEQPDQYKIDCVAPEGVGYGDGTISAKRDEHEEYPLTPEQIVRAIELLRENHDRVIRPVEEFDDGCGDGRPTKSTFRVIESATGVVRDVFKKSKLRAKVFGGGLQVAASMWRAVNGKPQDGETVLGDREFIAAELKTRDIAYGAHTDTHAHGENCGCGAIDRYEDSVEKSGIYQSQMVETLEAFYPTNIDEERPFIEAAFATRHEISGSSYMSNASGRVTMDFIEADGTVIKQLDGPHFEVIALFNDEDGTTLDQEEAAKLFRENDLPEGIQVFDVDIWRGRMYADIIADIAAQRDIDRDEAKRVALADFFINQLSVAAALTDGSLPVIVNHQN